MTHSRQPGPLHRRCGVLLALAACSVPARASEYHGEVTFNGLPVPGATVTARQGNKVVNVTSDALGNYTFPDLADGAWTIQVSMLCFAPLQQTVTVQASNPPGHLELTLQPLAAILAAAKKSGPSAATPALSARAEAAPKHEAPKPNVALDIPKPANDEAEQHPSDGFLISGTRNNAATSQYSLSQAFGNTRSSKSLYNGSLGFRLDNSAFDARPFSLTGLDTPKASYNRFTGVATFGGPLNLKHLLPHGPNFFVAYQWTRDRDDTTDSGLVPTLAERAGDFAGQVNATGQPVVVINPATGQPFANQAVPVSPQAAALLKLYPLPNLAGSTLYNYQTVVLSNTHDDALQARLDRNVGRKDNVYGGLAFEDSRTSAANLFAFVDRTNVLGLNSNVNWEHRFNGRMYETLTYTFSRLRTQITPNFANRQNVSAADGVNSNLQDPADWGPPNLSFSSITSLSDANSAFNCNETNAVGDSVTFSRGHHNYTFGADLRRLEFNVLSQQNPRGTFTFTGAATAGSGSPGTQSPVTNGSDLADFLIGKPDTSTIAYGNADKYLRQTALDAYLTDDWRLRPELTINAGMRWEYGAPETEIKNRLVNLDTGIHFTGADPVLASNPVGRLTGDTLGRALVHPDRLGFEPRIGLSWRPIPASTLVLRAGYGIYDDTSIYQSTALAMAQQEPLSTSLSVQQSAACQLSLAVGFVPCGSTTTDTFAVDPNLRVGYAQTWQLSAQRDLCGALVAIVTYLGVKGTRGPQEFLPNTYPIGATISAAGPEGYVYRASNGDSTRESGQVQLRRRLRKGFTASLQYTWSKSIDDDSFLGGAGPVGAGVASAASTTTTRPMIAQNWLNLSGERGLSSFDQRNLLNATVQYTSGVGLGGGTLLGGWRGAALKDWTLLTQITAGSGLPETPIYLAAVPGTGFTGSIRPNPTGASLYAAPTGLHLNPAAYAAPAAGQWGAARRNSITGPDEFSMNLSAARTLRLKDHYSLDLRIDSTNLLNHVTFTSWNTIVNGSTFGESTAANAQRTVQLQARLRY